MKKITSSFVYVNDSVQDIEIFLEPEGNLFVLPPNEEVLIKLYGEGTTFAIKANNNQISIWPEDGEFEVFYKGKDVLELL